MPINRRNFQYRLVWRRVGDRYDRTKVFNQARACFRFVLRLCGDKPWHGLTKVSLRQSWAYLAQQTETPIEQVIKLKTRDVVHALQTGNAKIAWLRIEMRQVGQWSEMIEPLESLKPKTFAKTIANVEAYCDKLDAHPELRWIPAPAKESA